MAKRTQESVIESPDLPLAGDGVIEEIEVLRKGGRAPNWALLIGVVASVSLALLLVAGIGSREIAGLFVLFSVFALLLTGMPIGISMIIAGSLGLIRFSGTKGATSSLEDSVFQAATNWSLSVIPMFVLMSMILTRSGLATKAFNSARLWLGRLPGGLAVATNFTGAGLAAASGSSIAISYALGRVGIPEMIRAGYRTSLATASVAMAGTLGQILPPSILLVVYAGVVQIPVGPQLIAGIVPGIILAVAYALYIIIRAKIQPEIAPIADEKPRLAEKLRSTVSVLPVAAVILIVIGGIFTGWLTATEAGAVGAAVALLLGWFSRGRESLSFKGLKTFLARPFVEMVVSTSAIFVLIIGVHILTRALALSRIPNTITSWLVGMDMSIYTFIFVLTVIYLILGMFLDPLAIMLLTVPILIGPAEMIGIDPIWFGVFVIVMAEIGQVSPPIGMLAFIVHKLVQTPEVNLGKKITLSSVFAGLFPFVGVSLFVLAILVIWPEIVLWLPNISSAN